MANPNRKDLDQVLETDEIEINPNHVNDWNICRSSKPFKMMEMDFPYERRPNFNITAAVTSPKSIKFRQRDNDFEGGKRGDYLFMDKSGGKMILPYKIFKRLFS